MKKMKRFLSLLLCFFMVAGMLPVGAGAASKVDEVVVSFSVPAYGASKSAVLDSITAENAVIQERTLSPDDDTLAAKQYSITLTIVPPDGYEFGTGKGNRFGLIVSAEGAVQASGDSDKNKATVTLSFEVKAPTPPAHEHTYGDYSKDADGHWRQCVGTDCDNPEGSKKDQGDHAYDNDQDASCNVCGYERTVTYTVTFNSNGGSAVKPQMLPPALPCTPSGNLLSRKRPSIQ